MPLADNSLRIEIDKNSPVPIYYQLQEGIKALILDGELSPNDRIPSENEFSELLDISPMTVRQALSGLVSDGFVYRKRGSGSFVSPKYKKHPNLTGFSEDMRLRGFKPSSQILEFKKSAAEKEVAEDLDIPEGSIITMIKRVRLANELPVGIHLTHIRGDVDINRKELERTESLYQLFGEKNVHLIGGFDELKAIAADQELSELLDIDFGIPLLHLKRITEDQTGNPVERVIAIYRADFYSYITRLK